MPTFQLTNATGAKQTGVINVPNNATEGQIVMDGASMTDPSLHVSIAIDFSPDGGTTWASTSPGPTMNPFPVIATFDGGATNRDGSPLATYGLSAHFPAGTNRRVRGNIIIDGPPLTTTITATAS